MDELVHVKLTGKTVDFGDNGIRASRWSAARGSSTPSFLIRRSVVPFEPPGWFGREALGRIQEWEFAINPYDSGFAHKMVV